MMIMLPVGAFVVTVSASRGADGDLFGGLTCFGMSAIWYWGWSAARPKIHIATMMAELALTAGFVIGACFIRPGLVGLSGTIYLVMLVLFPSAAVVGFIINRCRHVWFPVADDRPAYRVAPISPSEPPPTGPKS